jgi:hypothetical protein
MDDVSRWIIDGWVELGRGGGKGCLSETNMHRIGELLYMHENRAHRVGVGVDGRLEGRMDGGLMPIADAELRIVHGGTPADGMRSGA